MSDLMPMTLHVDDHHQIVDDAQNTNLDESAHIQENLSNADGLNTVTARGNSDGKNSIQFSGQQASSKLDSLSRDELIKIIRKQVLNIREIRKQITEMDSKAGNNLSATISDNCSSVPSSDKSSELITMELLDYKNSLQSSRKELDECKINLVDEQRLSKELSDRIVVITQEKENLNEMVAHMSSELSSAKSELEEKFHVNNEHSKQLESFKTQLIESKSEFQREIFEMNQTIQALHSQLDIEKQSKNSKNMEIRQLKAECDTAEHKLSNVIEEFNLYKEKAEFALKSRDKELKQKAHIDTNGDSSKQPLIMTTPSTEVQELVAALSAKNATISQLTSKVTLQEEEIQRVRDHVIILRNEIDSLNESLRNVQIHSQADRKLLFQDYERKLKRAETEAIEMYRTDKDSAESQIKELDQKVKILGYELDQLKQENERLKLELKRGSTPPNELPSHVSNSTNNKSVSQYNQSTSQLTASPPINFGMVSYSHCNADQQQDPFSISSVGNANSESEESSSSEDLQSIINGPPDISTNYCQAEHISLGKPATSGEGFFGFGAAMTSDDAVSHQSTIAADEDEFVISNEHFNELSRQLAHHRELLTDAEEMNIHLEGQVKLLKEEIRRFERNRERAAHINNTEYLKNIVLKFLSPPRVRDERKQLLPVLQTILRLTPDELSAVQQYCFSVDDSFLMAESDYGQQNNGSGPSSPTGIASASMASAGTVGGWTNIFGWR